MAYELMADEPQGNTLLSNLLVVFYLSMRTAARSQPRKRVPGAAKVAAHLAASPHEFVVTRFEQGLICAAAAFYRFYGSLLGREGRVHNVSGQDNAILQQIMAASRPLAVTDIARFANRDDIANIQYSLKKLVRAGLIAKAGRSSARETSYVVTPLARTWTASFVALRRQLFTDPSAQILGFDDQLEKSANLLNLIAGFYDHGTRVMTGAEQMETRRPTDTQASVSAP